MNRFLDLISQRVVVADGAMGTALHAAGIPLDHAISAVNLKNPELVRAVHESYIDAGAEIVQTNTFGASRLRLKAFDIEGQVVEINTVGVELARGAADAAPHEVLVAGSVSPPVTDHQRRFTSPDERISALREQMVALTDAGVDLLLLETFGHLSELVEAVTVAAEHSPVPIVAQATFGLDGRMMSGHTPLELTQALGGSPIAVLGVNCTLGPQGTLKVLTELARHTALPLSAQPNAGLPRRVSAERIEYEEAPEYFARYAERLAAAGAVLLGGCCGTTPHHISAMVKPLSSVRPGSATERPTVSAARPAQSPPVQEGWIDRSGFVVAAELVPTLRDSVETMMETAEQLREHGAQLFAVTPLHEPGAMNRSVELSALLQDRLGVPSLAAVTTWNRTIMALQAHLLGSQARGVTDIICETGNPPLAGDYPAADGTWDVDSFGLIELLVALNSGYDHHGLHLTGGGTFGIGARINPGAHDLAAEQARTRRKIESGAQFLVTRPIFETRGLASLLETVGGAVPVLVTLRPLSSFDEAEFLRYEVPEVTIPSSVMDGLEQAGPEAARFGIDATAALAAEIRDQVRGIVLRSNFKNTEAIIDLMPTIAPARTIS